MAGISTSVGPFSGIDSGALINQLLAIEARPKLLAQSRVAGLQSQRAALLDINSALLALKTASGDIRIKKVFQASRAVSSNESVLTATATTAAAPGSYKFVVSRLVSAQQQISRGFADKDSTGVGATSITFEVGGGRLDSDTRLSSLNGGSGVARGKIRITDRSGESAVVDLSQAVTVSDVLDAINSNGAANVTASVVGDAIRLTDNSGGAQNLRVENVVGYTTATSLGIAGSVAANTLTGSVINSVAGTTALAALNDGNGVSFRSGLTVGSADIKITARDGTVIDVELGRRETSAGSPPVITVVQTEASTLQQVIDRINNATGNGGKIVASINPAGTGLQITDTTGGAGNLKIEEGSASDPTRTAARDLGILADTASNTVTGRRLLSTLNSTLASNLNGGSGVGAGTFQITARDGATSFAVSVGADDSVSDIIRSINEAAGNGGTIVASLNRAGNGLLITDTTGGSNPLIITDTAGTAAAALKIATAGVNANTLDSGNLQTRYLSEATLLSSLNQGTGIGTGSFTIRDSTGTTSTVTIDDKARTLNDVIRAINANGSRVRARINDKGDGLLLYDDTGAGAVAIQVADATGSVAKKLNIVGTSSGTTAADNKVDGSFEKTIALAATDTLQQVADKINAAAPGATASVISDGSSSSPFRLTLTSRFTGRTGRLTVDVAGADLGLSLLSQGRDAVAFFGSADPATGVLLTSSTNTIDRAITGVTIDLRTTSSSPVDLVVSRDTGAVEGAVQLFVDSFNTVVDKLNKYDSYDKDTKKAGILLGDGTVATVRSSIYRVAGDRALNVSGRYQRLTEIGVNVGTGGKLSFNKERFREAYQTDAQAVESVLAAFVQEAPRNDIGPNGEPLPGNTPGQTPTVTTTPSTVPVYTTLGLAERFKVLMDTLTNTVDGVLTRRDRSLADQITAQNQRVATFDASLERKRARLERQFQAMERAIAQLRTQSSSLGAIAAPAR